VERETELPPPPPPTLGGAAFVRMSQEAGATRFYPAMQQAMASLESVRSAAAGGRPPYPDKESVRKTVCRNSRRCNEIGTPEGRFEGLLGLMPNAFCITDNRFAKLRFREIANCGRNGCAGRARKR